jgi:hypothetical protein
MKRDHGTPIRFLASLLSAGALAAVCLSSLPAAAQYVAPPVEVIATLTPVYHEGHAVYWYGGHWHYRGANGWAYYEHPGFLREHMHYVPVYHHYGRR